MSSIGRFALVKDLVESNLPVERYLRVRGCCASCGEGRRRGRRRRMTHLKGSDVALGVVWPF